LQVISIFGFDGKRSGGSVIENQVNGSVKKIGGTEKMLFNFLRMLLDQIHRFIHLIKLHIIAGRQIDLGQPSIPDPKSPSIARLSQELCIIPIP
jgi:hypothetical protein